jgi:outer membrane protein assembly factor BamB
MPNPQQHGERSPHQRIERGVTQRAFRAGGRMRTTILVMLAIFWVGAGTVRGETPLLGADPGDWPMYGYEPARTNANPTGGALNTQTVRGLVAHWQVNLGSNGTPSSASPVVAGGRVFVGSSLPSGPNFFALDAATGALLWQADLGYQASACTNVGIGATPAVLGDLVVAGGGDGAYYGLDAATGVIRWRHALDAEPSGFAWASPLVTPDRVYIGVASRCDNPAVRGAIRALDPATGALLAEQAFLPPGEGGAGIWNSPALSPDGSTLFVATGEDAADDDGPYTRALLALDPATLAIRASVRAGAPGRDEDWGTTPLAFSDRIGRTLVAAIHKNGTLYVYDSADLAAGPVWQVATGVQPGWMPAFDAASGTLIVGGAGGRVFAFDATTGAARWSPVTVGLGFSNLAVTNGLVFVNSGARGVRVLSVLNGRLVTTLVPDNAGPTYSGVTIAHDQVYWVAGGYLNVWGLPAPATATPPPPPTPAPPRLAPTSAAPSEFADPAFARLWTRTDSAGVQLAGTRSWLWGPTPRSPGLLEPYQEAPAGERLVQYFDKARMEWNDAAGSGPTQPFAVTTGLLVVELISGRVQLGEATYETREPANINVAGDTDDATAPTYASWQGVANTPAGDHPAPDRSGQWATATIDRAGQVGSDAALARYAETGFVHYERLTGHNIPRAFWTFLTQRGPVVETGQVITAPLSEPWFYASGLPISEPYWARVRVAGVGQDVLIQAFERRVLTYTPANPPAFQVESGNVGQHYYLWRYAASPGP